jgi:hypothetical protein
LEMEQPLLLSLLQSFSRFLAHPIPLLSVVQSL